MSLIFNAETADYFSLLARYATEIVVRPANHAGEDDEESPTYEVVAEGLSERQHPDFGWVCSLSFGEFKTVAMAKAAAARAKKKFHMSAQINTDAVDV